MSSEPRWMESPELQESEKIVRAFLLETCDVVRLTMHQWTEYGCFFIRRHGGLSDPFFRETLDLLKDEYIDDEVNNLRFNNVEQGRSLSRHFYFRISSKIKDIFNQETLLTPTPPDRGLLYGFEDPTFCRDNGDFFEIVGSFISHEPMLALYLDSTEQFELSRQKGFKWSE